jgi:hypothetical protein
MIRLLFAHRPKLLRLAGLALVTSTASVQATATEIGEQATVRSTGDSFVLLEGEGRNATMSGSTSDVDEAMRLRSGNEPLLYVRRDGLSYVVRDAATLRQAEALFEPQRKLGGQQRALGSRQRDLGAKQRALGQRQAALARAHLSGGGWSDEARRQQQELGREQRGLGEQQSVLGAEQARLGRQQSELAGQARVAVRALVDDALRRGLAQRVD